MVRIRVLGPLAADIDGAGVDLGGPRQRAVLARLLAARGEAVSVDRLIEDLWRGEPPPKATASLQAYVSNLRRALEPTRGPRMPARVLVSAPPGYALRLGERSVDAWEFERLLLDALEHAETEPARARVELTDALGLWRGQAFAEVGDEPWAAAETARLDELRLVARELLVAVSLRTGAAAEVVPAADALTREQPLREEGWRLSALALWASDRQADALAALRRARGMLASELGLDPGPALVDLEAAILSQRMEVLDGAIGRSRARPATAPTREAAAPGVPERSSQAPAPFTTAPVFVGRDSELNLLHRAADQARQHGRRIAFVSGEPGVGKSSLLDRLRHDLTAEGWCVLVGRCPETDDAPPAWAWIEALQALAETDPPGELTDAVAALLGDDTAQRVEPDAATGRFRLHDAVGRWLRRAAANRPIAVILDDVHDADAETLALLASVTGQLSTVPLLIVTAFRTAEADARLTETLAALARYEPLRLPLTGLTDSDVERLLDALLAEPVDRGTARTLSARTGGNPFYVRESARLLAAEGALVAVSDVPEGVRDVLRRRTARLPKGAVSVLRLAAVVGREADVEVLFAAADTDEDGVLDACEAGLIAGLLDEPAAGRVRFVHALVRDTLYTDLSLLRRTRMHARVAEAIRRLHPDDVTALAHHYASAATTQTAALAVEYSVRAARLAERRYASDAEVALLTQALECLDRAPLDEAPADRDAARIDLMGQLLRAQVRAGNVAAARDTRDRAVEVAERAGRDDLLVAAFTAWTAPTPWLTHAYGSFDQRAIDALSSLLRRTDLDATTRCQLLAALSSELDGSADPRVESVTVEAVELARGIADPALLALALAAQLRSSSSDRDPDAWSRLGAEIGRLGMDHDMPAYVWFGEHVAARVAAARNDVATMRQHVARALEIARAYQMAEPESVTLATEAMMAHVEGRFDEARHRYVELTEHMQRLGSVHAQSFQAMTIATVLISEGRLNALAGLIRPLLERFPVAADTVALALAEDGAIDDARAVRKQAPALASDYFFSMFMTVRAMAVIALDERDEAPALIEALQPYRDQLAGAASTSLALRPVAYTLGDLCRLIGRDEQARGHYARAVEIARAWCSPHWTAEAMAAIEASHARRS